MPSQILLDLVTQSILQERKMELEQMLTIKLRPFAVSLQTKSTSQLWDIKFHILQIIQQNRDDEFIMAVSRHMLAMVEEQILKRKP